MRIWSVFKSEGYHQTKFKIGYGTDWGKDIRRLEKARIALGEEFGIAVDANQAWDVETAFAFSKEAAAYHVSWFEEPIHAYDMAGLKQLRDKLDEAGIAMSVAMGESVRSYHTFAGYAEHGVDHLQPGNTRMYCIGENMKVWELAKEKGAMLSSGGFTFQNVVMGTLYGEEAMIEYHQPIMEVLVPYFSVVSEVKDGKFYLPDVPGLPVKMDFEKLERDGLLEEIIIRNRKKNEK